MRSEPEELALRIGGPQGSGIDRIASLFGRACATAGLHVFARREYHSNIVGRHSYLDLQLGAQRVEAHHECPNVLVTFEPESLCRHLGAVVDDGYVLYAAGQENTALGSLPFLDQRLRSDLEAALDRAQQPHNAGGLLALAQRRGLDLLAMDYAGLLGRLAEECGVPRRRAERALNTLAVGACAMLLGLPQGLLLASVREAFAGDSATIDLNDRAVRCAYEYVDQRYGRMAEQAWLQAQTCDPDTLYLNGTQSVALGKLAAGLGFQTYYPISPASDESAYLERQTHVPSASGSNAAPVVVQVEDELAAITMACGAALTGARCATSTSGPGFSLMSEGLGWAGMAEVPVVVSLYQRGGPSTGMPTRTEQGDLQAAIHAGHGESPRLVIASTDVASCFYDAMQAFDYAEHFQLPVIHLLDKALASTTQTVPRPDYLNKQIDRGLRADEPVSGASPLQRFAFTASGISPRPLLGQRNAQHWVTGVEHAPDGHVSEDPQVREQMMAKRAQKLIEAAQHIPVAEKLSAYGPTDAALCVLTWGSSTGAVVGALREIAAEGIAARAIAVRLLWPFPATELLEWLANAAPLVVVEANFSGQLNELLAQHLARRADHLIVKFSGRPIARDALADALRRIHAGQGTARMVLHNAFE